MTRVVFDTNIYISALITPGGRAEAAYMLALEGKIDLFTSIPILTETAKKLRDKFQWDDEKIAAAIRHISAVATDFVPHGFFNRPDYYALILPRSGKFQMRRKAALHLRQ